MDEKWRFHLESRIDALMETGLARDAAEQQARTEFGPLLKWKEESREARGMAWVDGLRSASAYAVRQLRRTPGFSLLVALTLAIGIGATTAMFSIVDAVLLRPLRFAGADRASEVWTRMSAGASAQPGITGGTLAAIREGLGGAAAVEGYQYGAVTLTGGTEPVIVSAPAVTPGLLHLVGASPLAGRLFNRDDATPGSTSVLLSERTWTSQFGRDPDIVGRAIAFDGQPRTVVGVVSARVRYPEASVAVWLPLDLTAADRTRRRTQALVVRHPAVSVDELAARLSSVALALREQGTLAPEQSLFLDDTIQVRISRRQGQPLWTLLGAVGLVLLVACANVVNLLLVRASNRRGELTVLSALGADRAALVRTAVVEVALLAAAGTMAGVALAWALVQAVPALVPPQLGYLTSTPADLNWRVIGFASVVGMTVSLLAGLIPAWRASRVDAVDAMKWQSRSVAGSRDERWQGAMLAVQIATVLVLLGGAGLLMQSFVKLTHVDPGYDATGLVSVTVQMTSPRYQERGAALATIQDLERRVEDAGVGRATFSAGTPITAEIRPEGEGGRPVDATGMDLPFGPAAPDYFETMGIPVLEGRAFHPDDGPDVIVVNDRLARTFWGEESAVGRRFRLGPDQPWRTVVGIAGDVRMMGLDDPTGHGMEFYTPHDRTRAGGYYILFVRSSLAPAVAVSRVKELLWAIDPGLPVVEAGSVRDGLLDGLFRQRLVLRLAVAFAAVALLLAGVGIYGVTACWVARRRRDLAIRVALGATGRHIVRLILSRTALVCTAGAVLGVAGSMAAFRVLASMLYETSGTDSLVLAGTAVLLAALVGLACLAPVRSALRLDPLTLLREE